MAASRYGRLKLAIAGLTAAGVLAGATLVQPGQGASAANDASTLVADAAQVTTSQAAPAANAASSGTTAATTAAPSTSTTTKTTTTKKTARVSRGS